MYKPTFTITNKILTNIGKIEAAREVIINAPMVPAWEKKFREEAIIRTVHHGTHIEGNELNISEAAKILKVKKVEKDRQSSDTSSAVARAADVVGRDRDVQEVINYRNVIRFIDDYQKLQHDLEEDKKTAKSQEMKENIPEYIEGIPEDVIKHLHKLTVERILSPGQYGEYRSTQVVVKNSVTGEITFRPPPAVEMPYLMKELVDWINDTSATNIHPVLKAGIVQYELVRIHPFLDGNGRVARALAMLILFIERYDIRKFFSIEEYYDRDSTHYYEALQSVSQESGKENLTPWLEYFTLGLAVELSRIKEKVQGLSVDLHIKKKLGGTQVFLSERQIKIVEYLQKIGFLQNQSFKELFPMISEDTVLRELKDLVKKGIIKKQGVTKAARYVLVK